MIQKSRYPNGTLYAPLNISHISHSMYIAQSPKKKNPQKIIFNDHNRCSKCASTETMQARTVFMMPESPVFVSEGNGY